MRNNYFFITMSLLCCLLGFAEQKPVHADNDRIRVILLTDMNGDPDDKQSFIRFLLYSNEFDIEGLIATTSRPKPHVFPEQLKERILAYGQVRENLLLHADGYPTTDYLLEKLHAGYPKSTGESFNTALGRRNYDPIDHYIGSGKDSDGSKCIQNAVTKDDPRPVWMLVWGGSLDLAQALWRMRETYSGSKVAKLISRIRVYAISDQDATGPWIREQFPAMFYIRSSLGRLGSHAGMYSEGDTSFMREQWVKSHIQANHGPLGELYPRANPYGKEGDTPALLYLIPNGLSDPNHPEYGGWGGRFFKYGSYFFDAEDEHPESHKIGPRRKWCVARWRRAYQHDFQARMDWCIHPPDQANHNPVAIINGNTIRRIINIRAIESDTLSLSAVGSYDPDGDTLSYHWYVYQEAGTFTGDVTLLNPNAIDTKVVIPNHVANGYTIHVILEVTDNGEPSLYAYRRAIITVVGK